MSLITVDVVLDLPEPLREQALRLSADLVDRMRRAGHPSRFQLGLPYPDPAPPGSPAGACEPHVSLFMLAVTPPEVPGVLAAVRAVAATVAPIQATGREYRHNPQGAPELYFRRDHWWRALQGAVVAAVEPLRQGRLRERDPAGERLADLIQRLRRDEPDGARLRQLLRCGYDEISAGTDDRFHPHVTLAWPVDPTPDGTGWVELAGLPDPDQFRGGLTELAVYQMSGHGTCTTRHGGFPLTGPLPDYDPETEYDPENSHDHHDDESRIM